MTYSWATLALSDGTEQFQWDAVVGFTTAPLPYIVLGHSSCLRYFNVTFFGDERETEIQKGLAFPVS